MQELNTTRIPQLTTTSVADRSPFIERVEVELPPPPAPPPGCVPRVCATRCCPQGITELFKVSIALISIETLLGYATLFRSG